MIEKKGQVMFKIESLEGAPLRVLESVFFTSKFRKIVRAGGPWFESGQRTFVELDKFTIKFRFSALFASFLQLEIRYGNK